MNTVEKVLTKGTPKKLEHKEDEIGKENNILRVKGCRIVSKCKLLKVTINDEKNDPFIKWIYF